MCLEKRPSLSSVKDFASFATYPSDESLGYSRTSRWDFRLFGDRLKPLWIQSRQTIQNASHTILRDILELP